MLKTYLLYVRKYSIVTNDYQLYVYKATTPDIFHTMGEILYRTIEEIKRIDYVEYTEEKEEWWKEQGYDVLTWHDKYPYAEGKNKVEQDTGGYFSPWEFIGKK